MTPFPPIDLVMIQAITDTFSKFSAITMGLVGAVMIARFSLLTLQFASVDAYVEVLREAITLLLTVSLFPFLFKAGVSGVSELAGRLSFEAANSMRGAAQEFFEALPILLKGAVDLCSMSFLYVVRAVFSLLLGVLCSAIPLILLSDFIFGIRIGIGSLGSTIFAILLWPVLWNIIGLLAQRLWPAHQTSLSNVVFSIVVQAAQFLSPVFCFLLLRSASPGAAPKAVTTVSRLFERKT